MECPHCGKDCVIPDNAKINVDSYNKSVIVATRCCGKPVVLSQLRMYQVRPYKGQATEDDWGRPFTK